MSYRILDLCGLCIDRVDESTESLRLYFTDTAVEKVMDNADQRTLWRQSGNLEVEHPRLDSPLPEVPFVIAQADVQDSLYTQRNMIRIPMEIGGGVTLVLTLEGQEQAVIVAGSGARLHLDGEPRYVRHLD